MSLLGMHTDEALVAFGALGPKTAADLRRDAAKVADALPVPTEGSHVLLVFQEDRYAMACALLGAWARGHAVCLPPSTRRDAVVALRDREDTVAVVHDLGAGIPFRIADLLAREAASPLSSLLPARDVLATVYTSGTTAATSAWKKTRAQLLGEAAMLGEVLDVRVGDAIVPTVSPGHIYGLLFGVLMPLLRGAAFSRETPMHAASIAHLVQAQGASMLVTVPLHVHALTAADVGTLASLRTVVSSTAPLSLDVAERLRSKHGLVVTEVLGSSETGGIARRARTSSERYVPFPGITVSQSEDRALVVVSPFSDVPGEPFVTADLVELEADGTFTHLGRTDGIVKIGGRRVAIADVETWLKAHGDVKDAAVAAVPAPEGREHQLIAAVVADEASLPALRSHLLERFEPICVPKRMLAVAELPREPNGKLPRARLMRLFRLDVDGRPASFSLTFEDGPSTQEDGREAREFALVIPEDYAWFEGHFPGYPVLAGAVQLKELVLPAVARAFPGLGHVREMSGIKFTGRILPGDALVVRVDRASGADAVRFEVKNASTTCAAGVLTFERSAA